MAVLAAAAFTTSTSAAQADVMPTGTWDGKVTGGTLGIGDEHLRPIAVPAGDPFTFTIPAGASAPVAFRAPATHVPIGPIAEGDASGMWTVGGSLDIAPIDGSVDPATGAVTGSALAHGLLRLDFASPAGGSSIYCQLGDDPTPAPPAPFALSPASANAGGAAWTDASGSATLTDNAFELMLNCGAPFITPDLDLAIVGHPVMPAGTNDLSLTVTFTRRADPVVTPPATTPPVTTTKPKTTPPPPKALPTVVKCIVPKLKGMKLKKARKAAKQAGCTVGKIKRKKSTRRKTTVLKQNTPVGAILDEGAKIKLTVAK
jgi:hypothetical protein